MSLRPTGFPGWASGASGAAAIAEPTASQKALGWAASQAPPHGYMNWLHALTYGWLKYLDSRMSGVQFMDDFVGEIIDRSKWNLIQPTGSLVPQDDAAAWGVAPLIGVSGTPAELRASNVFASSGTSGGIRLEARLRLPSGVTGCQAEFGIALNVSRYVKIEHRASGMLNWNLTTDLIGGVATSYDLGVSPTRTFQTFVFERMDDGSALVTVDGVQRFQGSLPGAVNGNFYAYTERGIGASYAATMFLDFLAAKVDR